MRQRRRLEHGGLKAKNFPGIATTEIDTESAVIESLMTKFWDREESLISIPVDCRWPEVTRAATGFAEVARVRVYVPQSAGTSGGAQVTLVLPFEAKNSDGTSTGNVRIKLGTGGTFQTAAIAAGDNVYTRKSVTIPAADVNTSKGTEVELIIEMERTAGTGTLYCKNVWGGASRHERA